MAPLQQEGGPTCAHSLEKKNPIPIRASLAPIAPSVMFTPVTWLKASLVTTLAPLQPELCLQLRSGVDKTVFSSSLCVDGCEERVCVSWGFSDYVMKEILWLLE